MDQCGAGATRLRPARTIPPTAAAVHLDECPAPADRHHRSSVTTIGHPEAGGPADRQSAQTPPLDLEIVVTGGQPQRTPRPRTHKRPLHAHPAEPPPAAQVRRSTQNSPPLKLPTCEKRSKRFASTPSIRTRPARASTISGRRTQCAAGLRPPARHRTRLVRAAKSSPPTGPGRADQRTRDSRLAGPRPRSSPPRPCAPGRPTPRSASSTSGLYTFGSKRNEPSRLTRIRPKRCHGLSSASEIAASGSRPGGVVGQQTTRDRHRQPSAQPGVIELAARHRPAVRWAHLGRHPDCDDQAAFFARAVGHQERHRGRAGRPAIRGEGGVVPRAPGAVRGRAAQPHAPRVAIVLVTRRADRDGRLIGPSSET